MVGLRIRAAADPRSGATARRALWWFAATTLPALLALAWLAWFVVRQDRLLDRDQQRSDAEHHADLAVAGLARTLSEFDQTVTMVAAGSGTSIRTGATLVAFDGRGVVFRGGVALPYYPAVRSSSLDPSTFAAADELEYRGRDPQATVGALLSLTERAPAIRGEAWMRLARVYQKAGQDEKVLDAYVRLEELRDVRVQDVPAGLLGRVGRCLLLSQWRHLDQLHKEARSLVRDLHAGRWLLTRSQYEHHIRQAADWSGDDLLQFEPMRQHFASAVEIRWEAWRRKAAGTVEAREAGLEWINSTPLVVLSQQDSERLALMIVDSGRLQEAWFANLPSHVQAASLALTDSYGRLVVGAHGATGGGGVLRAASVTRLPWNVHAAPLVTRTSISSGASLMLGAIGIMALVAVAAGYAIMRAVAREARVARLQSDFVAAVSHEFRTPLTSIRQLSELLARDRVSTPARRQEFLDVIVGESDRLQHLVENLLDFGKLETGRLNMAFKPVEIGGLLDEVIADAARDQSAATHTVEIDVRPDLPSVRGDRTALAHVFRNLLQNAMKYSPGEPRIWINAANGGGQVTVSIRDRGLGIPASEQNEIFKRFFRGSAPAAAGISGTGIGLTMAKMIVEAHGGAIRVESAPGHGSTFTVALPAGVE